MSPSRWHLPVVGMLCLGAALIAPSSAFPSTPADSWSVRAIEAIRLLEYDFSARPDGSWSAPNRANDLRTTVSLQGLRVEPRKDADAWELRLRLVGSGRGTNLTPRGPVELWVSPERDRIEIQGETLTEWYSNDPKGLEQGFTIPSRPDGPREEPVALEMLIRGDVEAVAGERQVVFRTRSGREVVRYAGLRVVDARGLPLEAHLETSGDRLRILFQDEDASYPVIVDPLVTDPNWSAEGGQAASKFGGRVNGAGNVNCDAWDDIVIAAEAFDNGQADEGAIFVFYGSAAGPSPTPDWFAEGNQVESRFGISVASAGDVNGDGCGDLIIGASAYDDGATPDEGWVFVYYGPLNPGGTRPTGNPGNANWWAEGNQSFAFFGRGVASAGDVNKDLVDDVIIGASEYTNDQAFEGTVFVYHGSSPGGLGASPATPLTANWKAESNQVNSLFGQEVASAGDVNGDGASDVIVGALNYENDFDNEGRVYLYLGAMGTGLQLNPVWTRDGGQNDTRLGVSVASAGDVNGDGKDDVLIGADDYTDGQVSEGGAFVFHGVSSGLLGTTPAWIGQVNQGEAFFGFSVDSAGDFNNDGFDDVIVGADGFDDGELDEGAAFLYLGSPSGLSNVAARTFEIDEVGAAFGTSVAGAGDVNGDGNDDVLVGSVLHTKVFVEEGGAFLFYGCLDPDRDGVCEGEDNCRNLPNSDQEDTDGDGTGNLCDPCEDADVDSVCDVPRVIAKGSGPGEQVKVQFGTGMRFLVNTPSIDPNIGLLWTTPSWPVPTCIPPSKWCAGSFGVGYETSGGVGAGNLLLTTNPPAIGTISVYTRTTFSIPDVSTVETLFLGADYDDAYVAWINGVEVYRSPEMPSGTPAFNTFPTIDHESSNGLTPNYGKLHDISFSGIPALVSGSNLLAIGVWNASSTSSDLVLVPRLSINLPVTTTMQYLANSSDPGLGTTWIQPAFNDTSWSKGNYGVGFEAATGADDLINTDVPDGTRSVFTRLPFEVAVNTVDNVFLGADYSDGYVVWLNGVEIFRSSEMPGTPGVMPPWNADPTQHESSNGTQPNYGTLQDITTAALGTIAEGPNLMCIAGWRHAGGDDLVLLPRISINEVGVDNCLGVFNPSQADLDLDGIGDACDPDIDGDGFVNASDNCPMISNNQSDLDSDGLGDACDVCPGDPANDPDQDAICAGAGFAPPKVDDNDNCPTVFNPDQADQDLDGLGNLCDPDIDGDGFANASDNCPLLANDQSDFDGDLRGDACDCAPNDNQAWEEPTGARSLLFGHKDACYAFACTQSQTSCTNDQGCLRDTCQNFACSQSLGPCSTNQNCDSDQCENFACRHGLNACIDSDDCFADFCNSKTCTVGGNACATSLNCTADFCANKHCLEGSQQVCTTNSQCTASPTDICLGFCSAGANPCVSNAACTADVCRGTCSIGANVCADDNACTADVCEGQCSIGANPCSSGTQCTAPQTDLCQGQCSIGTNSCTTTAQCTVPQTDLCRGTCFLGGNLCANSTVCTAPQAYRLKWLPPLVLGGVTADYDTLRSPNRADFTTPATCVETDGLDLVTTDPTAPLASQVFHYLIRTGNSCPGELGPMGTNSQGVPHVGRTCP